MVLMSPLPAEKSHCYALMRAPIITACTRGVKSGVDMRLFPWPMAQNENVLVRPAQLTF